MTLSQLIPGGRAAQIAVAAALAAIVALAVWFILTEPGRQRHKAAEAKAGALQAQGQAAAARDASAITASTLTASAAVDDQTRKNADAISAAPGASAPVDPRLADAGLRALCLRHAYAGHPRCHALLGPGPAGADGADAGSGPARR